MRNKIRYLLQNDEVSNYRISQLTGIAQSTLSKYASGHDIGTMQLDMVEKLLKVYREVFNMYYEVLLSDEQWDVAVLNTPQIEEAISKAKELAQEERDTERQVFIRFTRKSDGQVGYINNENEATDITGQCWKQ